MIQKCKAYKKYTFQGHVNKFKERMKGAWYEMSYEGLSLRTQPEEKTKKYYSEKNKKNMKDTEVKENRHIQGTASVSIFIFSRAEG